MADKPSALVQGTLDMLILKTLALEPMHGYGIAVRLEQMSQRRRVARFRLDCFRLWSEPFPSMLALHLSAVPKQS